MVGGATSDVSTAGEIEQVTRQARSSGVRQDEAGGRREERSIRAYITILTIHLHSSLPSRVSLPSCHPPLTSLFSSFPSYFSTLDRPTKQPLTYHRSNTPSLKNPSTSAPRTAPTLGTRTGNV